ncbi:HD domain-containing phosphohydrolase [Zavarzinella formosa]|uniref:HD domain-containing phosphohydrolase n=1 Tax=Zavarzinella formosa TaxID=360055 RepID=UPI000302C3A1|nr:HD domain-containing phosphohydrolase [Zavarzinella formosa]
MGMMIRLRGISGEVKGKTWESVNVMHVGRIGTMEIVLDDTSVSRRHADLRLAETGWWVKDLGSTNGTYVNGIRLGAAERQIHPRDIVQFGKVAMMVEMSENGPAEPLSSSSDQIIVEGELASSWQEGVDRLLLDRNHAPRPGDQLLTLLRASHHLVSAESEETLLQAILNDAVGVLDAQRGAIVLAEGSTNELKLKALATGRGESNSRTYYSQGLAKRCFSLGRSILCCSIEEDEEVRNNVSITDGSMASVLCVLLRTPRKHLGVIHLDRSYWQKPFTEDDLHLADALAAQVSAGIECAQLIRRQRELFLQTISALASAIEMRDAYTGGHTARVTAYSIMIGEQLKLSPNEIDDLRTGGPLHDIGKIGIDDAVLRKPSRLTDEEFEIMKSHTTRGDEILKTIPEMRDIRPIVRSHHERWDGRGYPDKLAGEAIPLLARVVAVADSFDAMTTRRPYNTNHIKTPEEAFVEVGRCAGTQFDPRCAQAFLAVKEKVLEWIKSNRGTTMHVSYADAEATGQAMPGPPPASLPSHSMARSLV